MERKQKVLLIRSSYLSGRMGMYIVPPLGILSLAGVLLKERPSRIDVCVLDTGINKMTAEKVARVMREYDPDVVGISSLSLEVESLHRLALEARQANPGVIVVAGGPHATCFYSEILKDPNVDYAVVGEGEITFVELLDAIRDGSKTVDIPGVACRRDGEIYYGGARPFIEDLDSIPIPAWELIDLKPYASKVTMNAFIARSPYAVLFTSRACPYRCIYCHSIFGKRFRAQSPERVLEEIELLSRKHGVRELHIYDDVFNLDRERVLAISEGVLSSGIDMKFAFPNGVRGDLMTRDVVKALVRAGAYSITYAVESASPRIQKLIQKNVILEKVLEAIEWTYEDGAIPCGFFMFGFPTETKEEMEQTIAYACRSRMLKASFFSVILPPGSQLYELAKKTYPEYNFDVDLSSGMYYWPEEPYYNKISGIDINAVFRKAYTSFYFDPWRAWNILKRIPKNFSFPLLAYHSFVQGFLGIGAKTGTK